MSYWCNNGEIEKLVPNETSLPDGFRRGRLPVSDSTRLKHSINNGIHKLTPEQELQRQQKISSTKQNKSEEEKIQYSLNLSKGRTGKGLGVTPWNKGKKGLQVPWNKGKTYKLSDISRATMLQKRFNTQRLNGTLGINQDTSVQKEYYQQLVQYYEPEDILHPYMDKDRYPYKCDFYIKSEDKFIEVHGNWTHGGRPFDPTDIDCLDQLAYWDKKAETSDYYKNAIYTWTQLDVQKVETARKNHLNFEVVYVKR